AAARLDRGVAGDGEKAAFNAIRIIKPAIGADEQIAEIFQRVSRGGGYRSAVQSKVKERRALGHRQRHAGQRRATGAVVAAIVDDELRRRFARGRRLRGAGEVQKDGSSSTIVRARAAVSRNHAGKQIGRTINVYSAAAAAA